MFAEVFVGFTVRWGEVGFSGGEKGEMVGGAGDLVYFGEVFGHLSEEVIRIRRIGGWSAFQIFEEEEGAVFGDRDGDDGGGGNALRADGAEGLGFRAGGVGEDGADVVAGEAGDDFLGLVVGGEDF